MQNPYLQYVLGFQQLTKAAKQEPLGQLPCSTTAQSKPNAPKVLIFSPHPDDEVIIGGIALRLLQESGYEVANVAVTLGSNPDRQLGRLEELKACCQAIGFNLITTTPRGLEKIRPSTRTQLHELWQNAVDITANILREQSPHIILFPHNQDWNSTHEGVHLLLHDALQKQAPDFSCITIETEFWGAMDDPNLMVEITPEQLADLITALTHHVGEVQRNPYHLTLPAWMMDNVRRGAELVGGQGGASPDLTFATLYRARRWTHSAWKPFWEGGRVITAENHVAEALPIT
jgi:LmbE family N-acetylglucosaminyl deacetylase